MKKEKIKDLREAIMSFPNETGEISEEQAEALIQCIFAQHLYDADEDIPLDISLYDLYHGIERAFKESAKLATPFTKHQQNVITGNIIQMDPDIQKLPIKAHWVDGDCHYYIVEHRLGVVIGLMFRERLQYADYFELSSGKRRFCEELSVDPDCIVDSVLAQWIDTQALVIEANYQTVRFARKGGL